jgi:4-amino-4-deoxy-L-arabinose transferase-like glycosyltransferase
MKQVSITEAVASKVQSTKRTILYLILSAAILRLLSLGLYPLMDTTEARYAEIARIMVELDDWVTPWFDYGVPFWGKPPLSFWLTAASFKTFGTNEFAARFPHWLAGFAVVWLAWGMAARRSARLALYTTTLLFGSALFFSSAGAVMTDMAMLVGTTMAMRGFWLGLHGADGDRRRERWSLFIGLGIGLLAKGPIALVLSALPIALWAVVSGNVATAWRGLPWLPGGLITLLIALPWYVLAETRTPGFLDYFLMGEHWNRFLVPGWKGDLYGSAHDFPHGSIWLFLFVDLLPWTLLLPAFLVFRLFKRKPDKTTGADRGREIYLWLWALTPAVFFTFSGNILWPYVLPGFPALALLAGGWLERDPEPRRVDRLLAMGLVTMLFVLCAFIVNLRVTGRDEDKSQKALVADYEARIEADEALIYLGRRQFSADFYSKGKVQFVPDVTTLAERLQRTSAYVAIPNEQTVTLPPPLVQSLTRVSVHGRYTLYLAKHAGRRPGGCAGGRERQGDAPAARHHGVRLSEGWRFSRAPSLAQLVERAPGSCWPHSSSHCIPTGAQTWET